jgi:large subunit ribosomal protein L9
MSIQVILTAELEKLGAEGDAVTVAEGYARNYLLPRGLAIMATPGNLRRIEALRKKRAEKLAAQMEEAKGLSAKLASHVCHLARAAGADNKLFGSITAADIAESLKASGFEIDRRKIVLERPIRELGVFEVEVKLHADVTVKVKLEVVAGEATPPAAEAATSAHKKSAKAPKKK